VRLIVVILAETRQDKGLSMNKLAWMAGVSPKAIAFIEQGKNSPTLRNICRLAIAMEIALPDLFSEAEKRMGLSVNTRPKENVKRTRKA
jgi:transcriptional regulator with XRE-family HTH domain